VQESTLPGHCTTTVWQKRFKSAFFRTLSQNRSEKHETLKLTSCRFTKTFKTYSKPVMNEKKVWLFLKLRFVCNKSMFFCSSSRSDFAAAFFSIFYHVCLSPLLRFINSCQHVINNHLLLPASANSHILVVSQCHSKTSAWTNLVAQTIVTLARFSDLLSLANLPQLTPVVHRE